MRKMLASILFLSICVIAALASFCGGKPQFIVQTFPSGNPGPGGVVNFQVGLDEPATGNQAVDIYVDDPSLFSSIPTTVYVQNGQSTRTFQATLTGTASGGFTIVAAANGEEVDCDVVISGTQQSSTYP